MVPPTSSAARNAPSSRPTHQSGAAPRRPPLRVVPTPREGARRRRVLNYVALAFVVMSLLAVVVGQAMLASGQVRLSAVEQKLAVAEGLHRQQELAVAKLETPSRIVGEALGQLHLVSPGQPVQLPHVSLTKPLPTPNVTPAAAATGTTIPAAGQ
jgi:hypothetical protein